ncbi:Alkaline phosphatase, tissue-nonspecific isozyme [Halotydeus destructor]|nr:Alkaline phosphatase, tissue-nonspecific isozyme [Halotydeus destructor]
MAGHLVVALLIAFFFSSHCHAKPLDSDLNESDIDYWLKEGRGVLEGKLSRAKEFYGDSAYARKRAKNVILFLGDGMGLTTVTAARIYKGQRNGKHSSERETLSWEAMPYTSLSKVFATDYQVSDSAAAATSYHTGVKTVKGSIGISGKVARGDCLASLDPSSHTESMFKWAQAEGKVTGFVTTTRVTHASPAPLYANSADRDWEATAPEGCLDIAHQLVHGPLGRNTRVVLGGGMASFLPEKEEGDRKDGRNLINVWLQEKEERQASHNYVTTRDDLLTVDPKTEYLMGLFSKSHMPYVLDLKDPTEVPSLAEMTAKALQVLERNSKNGYVLFVEGGNIDRAHHKGRAHNALEETYQFDQAVEVALNVTDESDTLIVVTADHSHTLTINGYAKRGNSILGLAGTADDKLPYTTLMYGNGKGYSQGRQNLTKDEVLDHNYSYASAAPVDDAKHGGEDVPVYARGPGAHLFTGVFDQSFLAHGMSHATCIGPHRDLCPADHWSNDLI